MLTIFDAANIVTQGFTADETYAQYLAMKPSLGWLHIRIITIRHPRDELNTWTKRV